MTIVAAPGKAVLRKQAVRRRGALDASIRALFSARLAEIGIAFARRLGAGAVSALLPVRDEPDALPLIGALSASGFCTVLPALLLVPCWRPGDPTRPGAMNAHEPLAEAQAVDPDLLFVPLACFDRRGHRIGFGAGHFDRTVAALRAAAPVTTVGVAFSTAQIEEIPSEPHDQRLDFVLTARDFIDCRDG